MSISHSWNGTVLTITSDSGTSSADLKGDMGIRGPQGTPGVVTGAVTSINGLTGDVVLTASDFGAVGRSELDNYITKAEIAAAIANYYTKEEINAAIANYYTKAETDAAVTAIVQRELGVIENGTY